MLRRTTKSLSRQVARVPLEIGDRIAWYVAYFILGYIASRVLGDIGLVCIPVV